MDLPKQGKLNPGLLGDILVEIYSGKFSGTLGLTNGEIKKVISFQGGKPISARSNVLNESLGGMLVVRGRLTQAQLNEIINELKGAQNSRIGEILLLRKVVTSAELEQLLKEQLVARITEPLMWSDGEYKIVEGKIAEVERISIDETIPELIYRVSNSQANYDLLKKSLLPGAVPVKSGGAAIKPEDIKMSGKELGMFRLINGTNTVENIISLSRSTEAIVLGFLNSLRQLGFINLKEGNSNPARPGKERTPEVKSVLSESSQKLYSEIEDKTGEMAGKNYFDYFGFQKNATGEEIKMAYFAFAKTFHPDRFPKDFTKEMRQKGENLFSRITEAFNILTDESKRAEYLQKIELEQKGISKTPGQVLESEIEFQKGQILLKKADFDGAVDQFKRAIALFPDEAEYHVFLGLALFRKGSRLKDASLIGSAKREIEKGLSRNSDLDRGYLYMGHIFKFEKNTEKAKHYYTKAVEVNPNCLEASSELRLMASRDIKAKKL